jgi:hypothetical protein
VDARVFNDRQETDHQADKNGSDQREEEYGRIDTDFVKARQFVTNKTALGIDEAKAGGTFIKIGVGVLRRPDEAPYDVFRVYKIVDGAKWTVGRKADSVEFTQKLSDLATGYAYVCRKTVSLTNHAHAENRSLR